MTHTPLSSRTGSSVAVSRRGCSCRSRLSLGLSGRQTPLRRDWRKAARRSRPSSSSNSERVAMIAATARPDGVAVSTPSRKARNVFACSPKSAIVWATSVTERPSRSIAVTTSASPGRA